MPVVRFVEFPKKKYDNNVAINNGVPTAATGITAHTSVTAAMTKYIAFESESKDDDGVESVESTVNAVVVIVNGDSHDAYRESQLQEVAEPEETADDNDNGIVVATFAFPEDNTRLALALRDLIDFSQTHLLVIGYSIRCRVYHS